MRPRFMNRGSLVVLTLSTSPEGGFNEAPIHESGKFPGTRITRIAEGRLQ